MSDQNSNQILRRQLLQQRRSLSPTQRELASAQIVQRIQGETHFLWAKHIGSFWPSNGEVDLRSLGLRRCQTLYFPILQEGVFPWAGKGLRFGPANCPCLPNRYGIPEPVTRTLKGADELDVILVPLLAFDRRGNRLGMGGGYYDRALFGALKAFKIGVAFGFQEHTGLTPQSWDVPLDAIVTESEWIQVKGL